LYTFGIEKIISLLYRMSNRWFDSSRQIFWDNNNQDLTIPGSLYISHPGSNVYDLSQFGLIFTQSSLPSADWGQIAISCNGQYQLVIRSSSGTLWRSSDYGSTWNVTSAPVGTWFSVAMSASGQYQTVVGTYIFGSDIYTSSNYGVTWTNQGNSGQWASVAINASGQYQTALLAAGDIFTSSNYGVTWTNQGNSGLWSSVAISASGQYQTAVSSDGNIFTSSNYGVTWTDQGNYSLWASVAMSVSGEYQTAVQSTGSIYTSSNYGVSWTNQGYAGNWRSVAINESGQYQVAVMDSGNIWLSSNYGVSWNDPVNTGLYWTSVAISANANIIAAAATANYVYINSLTPFQTILTNSSITTIIGQFSTIGINCNAPQYSLDVNGTGNFSNIIVGGDPSPDEHINTITATEVDLWNTSTFASTLMRIFVGNPATNYIDSTQYVNGCNANANLYFRSISSGVYAYPLTLSTSRVGINTIDPLYTLDITGQSRIQNDRGVLIFQGAQDSNSLYTTFQKSTLTAYIGWFGFGLQGPAYSNYFGMQGSASTSLAFYTGTTGGASPSLFLDSNGNIGINCNTPAYKFDLNGTAHLDGAVRIGASNAYYDDGAGRNLFAINTNNNGNYGMQIASPSSFMQFVPNASDTVNLIRSGSNFGSTLVGQDLSFQLTTTGLGVVETIRFTSTGRVGIGTATPAYTLDVTGTGRFVSEGEALRVQATQDSNSLFTTFQKATLTGYVGWFGFGLQGPDYSNYFGIQGSASTSIAFYAGTASGASPSLFLGSNSRVGILTNTPQYTLDINGQARILKDGEGLKLEGAQNSNPLYITFQKPLGSAYVGWFGDGLQGTNLSSIFGMQTPASTSIAFYAGAVPESEPSLFLGRPVFNPATGRVDFYVGIGCNTPGWNLDVVGNIHVSGQYFDNSDQRVKENIVNADVSICYSTMKEINLKYFQWNSNFQSTSIIRDSHQLGFLAQEIKQVFPNSVYISSNYGYDDFHGLEMKQINAMHYGATKKLMEIVEQQGSTIKGIQCQLQRI